MEPSERLVARYKTRKREYISLSIRLVKQRRVRALPLFLCSILVPGTVVELTSISMPIRQTLNLSLSFLDILLLLLRGNHENIYTRCSGQASFLLYNASLSLAYNIVYIYIVYIIRTYRSITICIGRMKAEKYIIFLASSILVIYKIYYQRSNE